MSGQLKVSWGKGDLLVDKTGTSARGLGGGGVGAVTAVDDISRHKLEVAVVTTRKPAGVSWETFVDRQIREAQDRGDFERLPGAGKPMADVEGNYDEQWWLRRKLKDEQLAYLPPALQARKEYEDARPRIASATTERQVCQIVAEVNARIRQLHLDAITGPPTTVMPFYLDDVLHAWRQDRPRNDQ